MRETPLEDRGRVIALRNFQESENPVAPLMPRPVGLNFRPPYLRLHPGHLSRRSGLSNKYNRQSESRANRIAMTEADKYSPGKETKKRSSLLDRALPSRTGGILQYFAFDAEVSTWFAWRI